MAVAGCGAEQVLRHKVTGELAYVPCGSWRCPACARMLAREWRAVLNWAAAQWHAPLWFITLTLREPLPLWQMAPPWEEAERRAEAVALARCLSRAFSRLVAEIRAQHGAFEYLAFVELTTGRRTPARVRQVVGTRKGAEAAPGVRWK